MLLRSLILSSHLFDSCTSEKPYFSKKIIQSEDFYKNAEEALITLVDADDRLSTLEKYFNSKTQVNG